MSYSKWKDRELDMIREGLTDDEIMLNTGRSLTAVQNKRYELTGHYKDDYAPEYFKTPKDVMLGACKSKEAREARIIFLAKKLGVRIKGVGK